MYSEQAISEHIRIFWPICIVVHIIIEIWHPFLDSMSFFEKVITLGFITGVETVIISTTPLAVIIVGIFYILVIFPIEKFIDLIKWIRERI